jgi:hypothetical protein
VQAEPAPLAVRAPGAGGAGLAARLARRWPATLPAAPLVAVGAFLGVAGLLFVVAGVSVSHLPYWRGQQAPDAFGGRQWLDAWAHWDSGWYANIAHRGYWFYAVGEQNPAAFFPAYPAAMRVAGRLFGHQVIGGIAVTVASGAAAAGLFMVWLRARGVARPARWTALALLLVYPFSFYLYGAVYADALFLAGALAAFVLVERDRLWLAGLAGAVATGARPVGAALLLPLVMRVIERRGGVRHLRWRDAGVLVAGAGVSSYCLFSWRRFGTPLAFIDAQRGWDQAPGLATWFKLDFVEGLRMFANTPHDLAVYLFHPVVTLAALALVPLVVRRFGWAYGCYVLVVVGLSAVSTKNFFGMSRYVLAAFPAFAAAGELLARRPRARVAVLGASGCALVAATSLYARGYYLS